MKKVKDMMTASVLSCGRLETIKSVASHMSQSNIGFVPVVDENRKVIGTITDRDVALALGRTNQPLEKLTAQDVMNAGAYTIGTEDNVDKALELMRRKMVGRLPVVDSQDRLKGVISLMGIARKVKYSKESRLLESEGRENIINTFHAIAERNHNRESIEEFVDE